MQRLSRAGDRGAVAVWVAVLMVPLLIVAALVVDVGAMHADRQRLQHGADAAALAIAQACAAGDCDDYDEIAEELARANSPTGRGVEIYEIEFDSAAGWVEVQTASERDHWFAPVIGNDDASITARGAASWNQFPSGGTHIPLAISWCEIVHWAGLGPEDIIYRDGIVAGLDIPDRTPNVTLFSKGARGDFHSCPDGTGPNPPRGYSPPGGFGWLVTDEDGDGCAIRTTTEEGGWYDSSTGRPTTCPTLQGMLGQTVLLPIFDRTQGTGSNAEYHIFGYVAFRLEGFRNNKGSGGYYPTSCGASDDCIHGSIERFIDYSGDFEASPGGGQFGVSVIQLRLPRED